MKNILKFMAAAFILGGVVSCEEDLLVFDTENGFVEFEDTSASTPEDGDAVNIVVSLGTGTNDSGVSVNFDTTILSGEASRYTISPSNGVLDFPAGQFESEITITPIDNIDADGNVVIQLDLSSSNSIPVGVAGNGTERVSSTITITDNDCPTVFADSYGVEVFAFGAEAPAHTVTAVPVVGTDNEFTVTSSWGPEFVAWATGNGGFSGQFPYAGTVVLNEDFTVDFVGDAGWATGGTGTYSACDDQFTITLTQALFTTAFTVDIVMTGN